MLAPVAFDLPFHARVRAWANRFRSWATGRRATQPTLDELRTLSRYELADIGLESLDAYPVARDSWLDLHNRI